DVEASRPVVAVLGLTFLLVSVRISLTRHFVLPAGQVRWVFIATIAGAACGVPLVVLGTWGFGPIGAALALVVSELVTTGLLVRPALGRLAAVREEAAQDTGADA
uniref:hypothetical protein n=1 Tax=Actinotalea sp. TaxID=1872145 RepID=UPI00356AF308